MEKITQHENIDELRNFREEIADLKKKELEAGESVHLLKLDLDDLVEDDMVIYRKLKNDNLSLEEFREYRKAVGMSGNESRIDFMAYIANMLTIKTMQSNK